MSARRLLVTILCVAVASIGNAQPNKPKQKKKEDLPDVALQIPEETRPEVRAILKENAINLSSKKSSERVKAAHVLGELGEQARPARGLLCRAMLDSSVTVRVAAADALKNIDPKLQYLAVAFVTEKEPGKHRELLGKIRELKEDGEPMAPLVANSAKLMVYERNDQTVAEEITTLSWIAKNDRAAYNLIASALDNRNETVRLSALYAVPRMKHGGLATRKMLALIKTEAIPNRVAAIKALAAVADKNTEEMVAAAIVAQRYHDNELVRQAVEEALNKLQYKQNP